MPIVDCVSAEFIPESEPAEPTIVELVPGK